MSRNYKFRDQEKPYFISFATVYWVDVFTRMKYKDILVESMNYCVDKKDLIIYAWVIMSNHAHMIIGTKGEKMENIIRDLKKFTSKSIIHAIKGDLQESRKEWLLNMFEKAGKTNGNNRKYQFWQQHNNPIELDGNEMIQQKLDYLHNNPVKEGIVCDTVDFRYSSAVDYANGKGLVKVQLFD